MARTHGDVKLASPEELAAALGRGEVVILVDHIDRENEGDFVLAADRATPERIAFMLSRANGGLLFLALDGRRCDELNLHPMVQDNTEVNLTPFTVSVDAREGIHTGVSVADRLRTVEVILHPASRPEDLARPGHLFPIRASERGVLDRAGHTEGAVDLCRIGGLYPAALGCEILRPTGETAGLAEFAALSEAHGLLVGSVDDIVALRRGSHLAE
ncbi:MAG: 3,4-dihydroxy-2-butanone-4-phosphate synthase [Armatimonadetes bacterium]|nr:3,4-dihydroxy-2-butanone-4-phosphate synthase [Armatimonadota bacterium]